jgi:phage shock protein PspC (stress-responsive transcriptional regulator)
MTRLYRSRNDRKIAGICGGFAELYDMDPTVVRLITLAIALVTAVGPLVIVYLIAWWVVPEAPDTKLGDDLEVH